MAKKYVIWDKVSSVVTPSGKVFTAEEWMKQYPMASLPRIKVVISGTAINGSFFGELESMIEHHRSLGCDFSNCVSDQDYLDVIADYQDAKLQESMNTASVEERTAAALEFIALNSLPNN